MKCYNGVGCGLSTEEAEAIVRRVIGSDSELRSLNFTPEMITMLCRFASGEISEDEYMAWAMS